VKPQIVIHIQPQAALKPAPGAPCNGCGICCLSEPCPLGMLLSRRRHGACMAVRWDASARQYRCGALTDATGVLQQALPRGLRWLAPAGRVLLTRLGRRWIAAGQGCDCTLEVLGLQAGSDRQSSP
jgi:hypothetical protein